MSEGHGVQQGAAGLQQAPRHQGAEVELQQGEGGLGRGGVALQGQAQLGRDQRETRTRSSQLSAGEGPEYARHNAASSRHW